MADTDNLEGQKSKKRQFHWLIYVAALLSGLLLIADAANFAPLIKITARLGVGLLYTAFAFIVGGTRASTYIGTLLMWIAIILTVLL